MLLLGSGAIFTQAFVRQHPENLNSLLPSIEPAFLRGKVTLTYDLTGGQIRDAIENAAVPLAAKVSGVLPVEVVVVQNKIPPNPVPILTGVSLDNEKKAGVFAGKDAKEKVGEVVELIVFKERFLAVCRLSRPLTFSSQAVSIDASEGMRLLDEMKAVEGRRIEIQSMPGLPMWLRDEYTVRRENEQSWALLQGSTVLLLVARDLKTCVPLVDPAKISQRMPPSSSWSRRLHFTPTTFAHTARRSRLHGVNADRLAALRLVVRRYLLAISRTVWRGDCW
jgi:hypothetical protein